MEGSITIPASAIWAAGGSAVALLIAAIKYVAGVLKAKDLIIAKLQADLIQKYKDDIVYLQGLGRDSGND